MKQTHKTNKIAEAIRNVFVYGSSTLLLSMAPQAVIAAEEVAQDEEVAEVIQVTGNRATMSRSLSEKKHTVAVVDAIAAADFGDLPGLSLSDVIENVPGATGHRLKGSQNEISLRGLGPFLGSATFNGRPITNAGPNRAVNFKKFPSELVDKVVVYKSQQADLVEGGVSGTIEVGSLRPVSYGKEETIVEVTGVYNQGANHVDGFSPYGKELLFSTVQKTELGEGHLGYTLGLTYSDSSNPEEIYTSSSTLNLCALRNADGSDIGGTVDCDARNGRGSNHVILPSVDNPEQDLSAYDPTSIFMMPNSFTYRSIEDEDERKGIVTAIQYTPNEHWDFNFDAVYSKLEYVEHRHEYAVSNSRDNHDPADIVINNEGALTYYKGLSDLQLIGERRSQVDEYTGWGLKTTYTPDTNLKVELDVSYSDSERYRLRHRARVETANEYNYTWDRRNTLVPSFGLDDANGNAPWEDGFDATSVPFDQASVEGWGNELDRLRYYREHEKRDDTIYAARLDVDYYLGGSFIESIKTGVRYSQENMVVDNDTRWTKNMAGGYSNVEWDSQNDNAKDADGNHIVTQLLQDVSENCISEFNNNNFFGGQDGTGSGAYAMLDGECTVAQMYDRDTLEAANRSYTDIGENPDTRSSGDVDATESVTAAYIMANYRSELAGIPIEGNFGVRAVHTEIESLSWNRGLEIVADGDPDPTTGIQAYKLAEASVSGGSPDVITSSNLRWLPSATLIMDLHDEVKLRFAGYRSLSRVALQDMGAGRTFVTDDSGNDSVSINVVDGKITNIGEVSGLVTNVVGGNPTVAPLMSWNGDISLEWYPSEDAYLSAAYYWKRFNAVLGASPVNEDFNVAFGDDTYTMTKRVSVNDVLDQESTITGIEISAQKHFSELPAPFDGIGIKAAYNYADSDYETIDRRYPTTIEPANMWGNSKETASASVYWDFDDVSFRVLYKFRSKYYQPSDLFDDNSIRHVLDSEYLDFSAKYKINKTFSVSLKALNLLNEPQVQVRGVDSNIHEISSTGSKYFLSLKAKF
ncbi:TonB-dependent receptor (plasmid) [Catenovulum sp. SX2]|uniref:TonB-dependent receptor n=1 Tax=Catenovulum sp. SX2 TaxID=3398614 RepID=UPI003F87782C